MARRRVLAAAAIPLIGGRTLAEEPAPRGQRRVPLPKPGPMLPPVPAILVTVNGRPGEPDEISVLWTFVVNGNPPQVGVSAGDEHRANDLIALHREFVLNVPVASIVRAFDLVDMSSSRVADKFALSGLTRGTATVVKAPTVAESPIQVECRVSHVLRVPPARTVYLADVVATTVHEGACDESGRLRVSAVPFFGMTAGSGEFFTMGEKVGHIGQTAGRSDIRY
jgi:flavin reductase (DIM6/NTAB) family NADH-FMN oxidoreductase RutF